VFLTLETDGDVWLASCPSHFTLGERAPGINWVGPRASLTPAV